MNQFPLLPPEKDRRRKLTPEKVNTILDLYKKGESIRAIARAVELDRNTLYRVIRPEKYKRLLAQRRQRAKDGRYKPDKKEWRETMRKHRAWRRTVFPNFPTR